MATTGRSRTRVPHKSRRTMWKNVNEILILKLLSIYSHVDIFSCSMLIRLSALPSFDRSQRTPSVAIESWATDWTHIVTCESLTVVGVHGTLKRNKRRRRKFSNLILAELSTSTLFHPHVTQWIIIIIHTHIHTRGDVSSPVCQSLVTVCRRRRSEFRSTDLNILIYFLSQSACPQNKLKTRLCVHMVIQITVTGMQRDMTGTPVRQLGASESKWIEFGAEERKNFQQINISVETFGLIKFANSSSFCIPCGWRDGNKKSELPFGWLHPHKCCLQIINYSHKSVYKLNKSSSCEFMNLIAKACTQRVVLCLLYQQPLK